jgi:hypothetical protein
MPSIGGVVVGDRASSRQGHTPASVAPAGGGHARKRRAQLAATRVCCMRR